MEVNIIVEILKLPQFDSFCCRLDKFRRQVIIKRLLVLGEPQFRQQGWYFLCILWLSEHYVLSHQRQEPPIAFIKVSFNLCAKWAWLHLIDACGQLNQLLEKLCPKIRLIGDNSRQIRLVLSKGE